MRKKSNLPEYAYNVEFFLVISYTLDDGSVVEVRYQADENGFQAQSPLLPVAPEFPHPIPQFVLDQIAFAAQEDARRPSEPSGRYGAP